MRSFAACLKENRKQGSLKMEADLAHQKRIASQQKRIQQQSATIKRQVAKIERQAARIEQQSATMKRHAVMTARYVSGLFKQKKFDLLEDVLDNVPLNEEIKLLYRLRLYERQGQKYEDIDGAAESYFNHVQRSHRNLLVNVLIFHAISQERGDLVERLVLNDEVQVPTDVLRSILRFFISRGQKEEAKNVFLRADVSAFARLTLLEELHLLGFFPEAPNWRRTVERFMHFRLGETEEEIVRRFLIDPLLSIPEGDRDLMDIRFSRSQREVLKAKVLASLKNRQACSLIRLGDGEAYAFSKPLGKYGIAELFDKDFSDFEIGWWGTPIPDAVRLEIQSRLRCAISRADILGIPSIYRVLKHQRSPAEAVTKKRINRAFMTILSQLGTGISLSRAFTEERCHHLIFSREFLRELIAAANRVVVVTCWGDAQLGDLGLPVSVVRIAPEIRAARNVSDRDLPPLWSNYNSVCKSVEELSGPGVLVLVGAGLIGKIIVDCGRTAGAVALDIGAVLDTLAGYQTRSPSDAITLSA